MNLVNKPHDILNQFLHNPVCWSCGLTHSGKQLTCAHCFLSIKRVVAPCKQCGLSHAGESDICLKCQTTPKLWQEMAAPLSYKNPISHLIQQLKYNQQLEVLQALIELVLPAFRSITKKPDILISVPLHLNRYLERGFNQSYEMAKMLSKNLNIKCSDSMVERVIDTVRQSELKLKQREKNIKNAFQISDELGEYDHVVIIDDVITSGSTVHELVKQCLRKGVKRVDVWAIARTEL